MNEAKILPHVFKTRIYYENTDAQGIVYHAEYLKFAERARTEFLRERGIHQEKMRQQEGCIFSVTQINIKYKGVCILDDLIEVETTVKSLTPLKIVLCQTVKVGDVMKTQMEVDVVVLGKSDNHKNGGWYLKSLPRHLLEKLKEYHNA